MRLFFKKLYNEDLTVKEIAIFSLAITLLIVSALYLFSSYLSTFILSLQFHKEITYTIIFFIGFITSFLTIMLYRYLVLNVGLVKYFLSFLILGVISVMSLTTSSLLDKVYSSSNILNSALVSLNSTLPVMIDTHTRFERVYMQNNKIYYEYTLTDISSKNLNRDFISLVLMDKLSRSQGLNSIMFRLSKIEDSKRDIYYIFNDRDRRYITSIKLFR